jgi:hypothetical protein
VHAAGVLEAGRCTWRWRRRHRRWGAGGSSVSI